jgi:L-fuconolactonase
MNIDTHQHFWKYNNKDYVWMSPAMDKLRRDHLPKDLIPLLKTAGIGGTIAVQARQTLEESGWLLQLAEEYSFIRGVVGWVDLSSERVAEQLEQFSQHRKFRGVRHVVHDEPDDEFMLQRSFLRGLSQLERLGLTYDLLLFPRHLRIACEVVSRFPNQPFVLDHIAKPAVQSGTMEPWTKDLKELAAFPNVFCKISGLVTEVAWDQWRAKDFEPYIDVVLNSFGAHRLMIGSDWPVCTLAAGYKSVIELESGYISRLSSYEQNAILEKNPLEFYSIQQ